MTRNRIKKFRKGWNKMEQQIASAASRRKPGDKPTKGMRRFKVKGNP